MYNYYYGNNFNKIFFWVVLDEEQKKHKSENPIESEFQKCKFLLSQALNADERNFHEEAIKLYTDAAELGLKAVSLIILDEKIFNFS